MFKKEKLSCYKGLFLCVVVFILGEIMLNTIAPMENPPLGPTLNIVLGTAFMLLSPVAFLLIIKHLVHVHRKERYRKRNPNIYLTHEEEHPKRRKKRSSDFT